MLFFSGTDLHLGLYFVLRKKLLRSRARCSARAMITPVDLRHGIPFRFVGSGRKTTAPNSRIIDDE